MAIAGGFPPRGLTCPDCGDPLVPAHDAEVPAADVHRLACTGCGGTYRARRRGPAGAESNGHAPSVLPHKGATSNPAPSPPRPPAEPPATSGLDLVIRSRMVRLIAWAHPVGVKAGVAALLPLGGFVPVIRAWLADELSGWASVVETLGGVWHDPDSRDPEADLGPILARLDAPNLFHELAAVARRLGVRPPDQVRLTYLPCCGVVAWRRSRILLIGLPLLQVLSIAELRAVLAHELAHLARGDADHTARAFRYIEGLGQAIERAEGRMRGPLRWWSAGCRSVAEWFGAPVGRGQETRADKVSATVAGGGSAASALVKVAMVQPLFREVLDHHDPHRDDLPNLYALFRLFWRRLPDTAREAMRLSLLVSRRTAADSPHPPLPDRLAHLHTFADPPETPGDRRHASSLLCDLEAFEQLMHNRLFGEVSIDPPSVFHRIGG
ncbi:MAG: M48 family metallopeptidase [Isosphaeraceae bacterium]|nr:M48 family metallopeptidase [Isosphaeraceae bacterium]